MGGEEALGGQFRRIRKGIYVKQAEIALFGLFPGFPPKTALFGPKHKIPSQTAPQDVGTTSERPPEGSVGLLECVTELGSTLCTSKTVFFLVLMVCDALDQNAVRDRS